MLHAGSSRGTGIRIEIHGAGKFPCAGCDPPFLHPPVPLLLGSHSGLDVGMGSQLGSISVTDPKVGPETSLKLQLGGFTTKTSGSFGSKG